MQDQLDRQLIRQGAARLRQHVTTELALPPQAEREVLAWAGLLDAVAELLPDLSTRARETAVDAARVMLADLEGDGPDRT